MAKYKTIESMKTSIIATILLFFLTALNTHAQQLVTLNRNKIQTEQKAKSKKKTSSTNNKQTSPTKHKSSSRRSYLSRRSRHKTTIPKEASYLRINNQYGDITDYPTFSGGYKTYSLYTDGQNYSVTMLPSWCKVTSKNSNSFTVYIDTNDSYEDRFDWFYVNCDNKVVKVYLKQSGKPMSVTASYQSGHLTHNYNSSGEKYIKVNATLNVSGAKNIRLFAVATVQDEYGNQVHATPSYSNYKNNDGTFCTAADFTPTSDDLTPFNVTIYIPNNALKLYNKRNKLICNLSLYCEETGKFVSNASYSLVFNAKCKKGIVTTTD